MKIGNIPGGLVSIAFAWINGVIVLPLIAMGVLKCMALIPGLLSDVLGKDSVFTLPLFFLAIFAFPLASLLFYFGSSLLIAMEFGMRRQRFVLGWTLGYLTILLLAGGVLIHGIAAKFGR